ncbi:MAG: tripartite tricarboxylate transporter substrate binding protein [Alcaligenaceae bacterium]|nr:MAG: tripartite tricarboxylate transporter substrate binding protein [Alcaligenaceae bacterium]
MQRRPLLALVLAAAAFAASAQDAYPNKTIKIIVPFGGGSGSDASARYFAEKMGPLLGESIIVDNKPGADGAIGMRIAKSLPADGYTLVQGGSSPSIVNAVLYKELGYDPVKDFLPLGGYGRNMTVLLVPNESPFRSFADVVAYGKKTGKPINVGTFSATLNVATAYLGSQAGVKFTNVPYKGQAQATTDLMGQLLDMAHLDLGGASPLIRNAKLRALAVAGDKRHPDFPDIPTIKESGLADFTQYSWNALYVRADTPPAIRAKLSEAVLKVMTDPETIRQLYKPKGTEGIPLTPAQMQTLQKEEIAKFQKIADSVDLGSN